MCVYLCDNMSAYTCTCVFAEKWNRVRAKSPGTPTECVCKVHLQSVYKRYIYSVCEVHLQSVCVCVRYICCSGSMRGSSCIDNLLLRKHER
jgi:hypothetical protein